VEIINIDVEVLNDILMINKFISAAVVIKQPNGKYKIVIDSDGLMNALRADED